MPLALKSNAFRDGGELARAYTGEGDEHSPPLTWSGAPPETREYALICEDPDAPGGEPFVHWLTYNIGPSTTSLPEAIRREPRLEVPLRLDQGRNSFGKIGYAGPMPPVGHGFHRYVFTLYALDKQLRVPPGASKEVLLDAIRGHVIDSTQFVGRYRRDVERPAA
jgi:Raf kinase inhibitor-like YbhB/YbcL family protein